MCPSRASPPAFGGGARRRVGPLRYSEPMSTVTAESSALRLAIEHNRGRVLEVLARYGAANPRVFGSVARGDATASSDLDLLVDLLPGSGNPVLRVSGIGEELGDILGVRVDVVAGELMRDEVSATAHADAVPL
jgi:predicted nucleotidyltransferase